MTLVHSLVKRETGFESIRNYDVALYRLICYNRDVYRGMTPSLNLLDVNPEPPVFACRFCTTEGYEQIVALANEDGKIALQDTTVKRDCYSPLEGTQAHCNAIFDIAWMPGEMKLVTVSGDHSARLWDVSQSSINQVQHFQAHTRSVKTAVFRHQDKAVFATGARDGCIMVWDVRATHNDQPKPDNCIANAHSVVYTHNARHRRAISHTSRAQSVTGLAFQDDFTLLSCSAGDGMIKVWDLRKNYTVHKKDPLAKHVMNYTGNSTRNGFSSLLMCPYRITLYASCMDNIIYAYNISSYNPKPAIEFYGHQNRSYYVKTCLSPDGRYLASGSGDGLAYIWNTQRPGAPLVRLVGHTEEVTCVAWCNAGGIKIMTCSDDSYHRIWRVGNEHKGDNDEIEVRGRAEIAIDKIICDNPRLETTPTVSRRGSIYQERTPSSDGTMAVTPDQYMEDRFDRTRDRNLSLSAGRSMKRTYTQLLGEGSWSDGKFKSILSPIQENLEMIAKRAHMDNRGARRLFSPGNDRSYTTTSRDSDLDEPSTSRMNDGTHSAEPAIPFSPTLNLPNFVIDGTAPHLVQISPEKCKENVDWLTKIRKERYEQKAMKALPDRLSSPKTPVTPGRRRSRSRSTEPQKHLKTPKTPAPSLLDFFKLTAKEDCDESLCSKTTTTTTSTTESTTNGTQS